MSNEQTGRLLQINVSQGGLPKTPVARAAVGSLGVEGDKQRDLRHHGGPTRAVCLYSVEQIKALQEEGHPIEPGNIGENCTTEGIDLGRLRAGDRLAFGDSVLLEITAYAHPCTNIAPYFREEAITRVSQKVRPGWSRLYARVLRGGELVPGQPIRLLAREELEDGSPLR